MYLYLDKSSFFYDHRNAILESPAPEYFDVIAFQRKVKLNFILIHNFDLTVLSDIKQEISRTVLKRGTLPVSVQFIDKVFRSAS